MSGQTVLAARYDVYEGSYEPNGIVCPCCDQRAARRERAVTTSMLTGLRRAWRLAGQGWFRPASFLTINQNCDFAKLTAWGLIERTTEDTPETDLVMVVTRDVLHWVEKSTVRVDGTYRITTFGMGFLSGHYSIPRHGVFFNGVCEKFVDSGDRVKVFDIVKGFDLAEVMAGATP
jgi:hypothetical protein